MHIYIHKSHQQFSAKVGEKNDSYVIAEYFHHGLGIEERHFQHAAELLRQYGARDSFCVLTEDATALQVHLEPVMEGIRCWCMVSMVTLYR